MRRSDLADLCQCACQAAIPAVAPYNVIYTDIDALLAMYHCQVCGRWWTCAWNALAAGWPPLIPINQDPNIPVLEDLQ